MISKFGNYCNWKMMLIFISCIVKRVRKITYALLDCGKWLGMPIRRSTRVCFVSEGALLLLFSLCLPFGAIYILHIFFDALVFDLCAYLPIKNKQRR